MSFYDLSKSERLRLIERICAELSENLFSGTEQSFLTYFSDEDTYIRKAAYLAIAKLFKSGKNQHQNIFNTLENLFLSSNEKVRQTVINAAGEIGIYNFSLIENLMEKGMADKHHSVRNAVIGSLKKMGAKNPVSVIRFAKTFLHHPDKEIRRQIIHGIELRGRTHPDEILPLLKEIQFEESARVRKMLIHVLGQISYKKGCLEKVVTHLNSWQNINLVNDALNEIIDVHERYRNFSALSKEEAVTYIEKYAMGKESDGISKIKEGKIQI